MIDFLLAALFVAGSPTGGADARPAHPPKTAKPGAVKTGRLERVAIHADKLQVFNRQSLMIWTGNVEAQRGTVNLKCDQAVATYTDASQSEISRIQCSGHTVVTDRDRWAKGEHADFDNVGGLLVVTGQPQARQGTNRMKGTKVIFHLPEDTVEVENARALFTPTPEQSQGLSAGSKQAAPGGPK